MDDDDFFSEPPIKAPEKPLSLQARGRIILVLVIATWALIYGIVELIW